MPVQKKSRSDLDRIAEREEEMESDYDQNKAGIRVWRNLPVDINN